MYILRRGSRQRVGHTCNGVVGIVSFCAILPLVTMLQANGAFNPCTHQVLSNLRVFTLAPPPLDCN